MGVSKIANVSYSPVISQKKKVSFSGNVAAKVSNNCSIEKFLSALGNVFKADVSVNNVNKLFFDNNFKVDSKGHFFKKLSVVDNAKIENRFGKNSDMVKDFFKPLPKETLNQFKEFLSIGDNYKVAKNNFDEMYILFSSMNESMKSYDKTIEFFKQNPHYAQFIQNLASNSSKSSNTINAISNYKFKGDAAINSALRTNNISSPDIKKQISYLSSFIDSQVIKNPVKLYRGEGLDVLKNVKLANGKTINLASYMEAANGNQNKIDKIREFILDNKITAHENGFMSTTMDKKIGLDFASVRPDERKNTSKMLWILETKPNTKGAYLDPLNLDGKMSFEKEVLLQKGSDIQIKDIVYKDGLWFLKGEVSN